MKNKISYVLSLFAKTYGLQDILPEISYSQDGDTRIVIRPSTSGNPFINGPIPPNKLNIIWKFWKERKIPFFFTESDQEIITQQDGKVIINFDIISCAFFLLSGWHEYYSGIKDNFNRISFESTIQNQLGITRFPIVNCYFDILFTAIKTAFPNIKPRGLWGNSPYAICLTHDIDTCKSAWIQGSFWALKQKRFDQIVSLLSRKVFFKDAWFNFEEILNLEYKYAAQSTFFFLPQEGTYMGVKNADYKFSKKEFRVVEQLITSAGSEVALHGSIGSSTEMEILVENKEVFVSEPHGVRFHFLMFDTKITPSLLETSGFNYDSTLGFAEEIGFRNSFCFPFYPYDIIHDKPFEFVEIPLSVMDGTLQKYLHLTPEQALPEITSVVTEIKKFNGCSAILWHNTHFSDYKFPGWRQVYDQVLAIGRDDGALLSDCNSILKRWQ